MTEALGTVIDYLLDRVGVARIEAYCDQENHASQAVIEKCGMKYEGTLRSSIRSNQGITDACLYASLRSD